MKGIVSVRDAVGLVRDGARRSSSAGPGPATPCPQRFIDELAAVFEAEGRPRDLTTVRIVGIGDFADRGFCAARLCRACTAGRSAATSATSRGWARWSRRTSSSRTRSRRACSPADARDRRGPARAGHARRAWARTSTRARPAASQNARTTEDLVEVVDAARARSSSCSTRSRSTSRSSAARPPTTTATSRWRARPSRARCCRWRWPPGTAAGSRSPRSSRLAPRGSLPLRDVKVPGALVDYVFVDPDQWQTYVTQDSPYYAGALRRPVTPEPPLPLDVRKIIARRSLLEFPPRGDLQPRLRDQPAHRAGRLGGGHHRPAGAHRGAGHLRRRPGRRATRAGPGSTTRR